MIKLKDVIEDLELGKVYTDKDRPPFQVESVNEAQFSKDQIEIMRKAYGTLKTMNPTSPTYKKFIKFLEKLPKNQLKQLAAANIKFVSMLAKNRIKGESVNEKVARPFSEHLRKAQDEIEYMISNGPTPDGDDGVYDKPREAMKLLQIAQKSLGKIK